VLRALVDTMVFDALAGDEALLAGLDRLTRARRVELLAAAETMAEIAATPAPERRRRLQRVRVLVVPPAGHGAAQTRVALAVLRTAPGVSDEDAAIAAAALAHGVPLVTEDRDLREAVRTHLPGVALWSFAGELAPRLAALAAELGPPPSPARPGPVRARRRR